MDARVERRMGIIRENINLMIADFDNLGVGEMHRLKKEVDRLYDELQPAEDKCSTCDCMYPCRTARDNARDAMR